MTRRNTALVLVALFALGAAPLTAKAQGDGPPQEAFLPKSQKGPIVVLISGASGPASYRSYASDVANLGYYAVLIDGKDILTRAQDGARNLRTVMTKAQASPNAISGKASAIGFSQGGGAVLAHAAVMPELFNSAVAYYPTVSWARSNIAGLASRIQIPVLVLAGERDRYNNCCLIEHLRELESAAKAKQIPLDLVVYPDAVHGFNLPNQYDWRAYRSDDTADAWRRTKEMLQRHHPVQ